MMEVEKQPKKSKIYGEILSADNDLEVIHWLLEPTSWITSEHTGNDIKGYWARWNEEQKLMNAAMQTVEAQMAGDSIDFSTFKWTMRQLKDHVLVMRAICDKAAGDAVNYRSRKIMHAPAEKFYSRSAAGFSVIIFICGIGTGILELLEASPSWLALMFFIISACVTYLANWFAERWGARERKLRKLQKIIEQRGVISSARIMIDAVDFDENTLIAIMKQRTHIENSYSPKDQRGELASLGRAVAKMERRATIRNGVVLSRGTTTVKLSTDVVSKRRAIEKMLATENLDEISQSGRRSGEPGGQRSEEAGSQRSEEVAPRRKKKRREAR